MSPLITQLNLHKTNHLNLKLTDAFHWWTGCVMLPARWRRSTFLTEQMNTLSSFQWNGDLNSPLMEVLTVDNNKKNEVHYVWKLLSLIDSSFMMKCTFSDTVDSITPDKVRGLRDMLNSSAMDIMYYTSPLYRDEVTHSHNPPFFHSFSHYFSFFQLSNSL